MKTSLLRGPECLPADFLLESKIIDEDSLQFSSTKKVIEIGNENVDSLFISSLEI